MVICLLVRAVEQELLGFFARYSHPNIPLPVPPSRTIPERSILLLTNEISV